MDVTAKMEESKQIWLHKLGKSFSELTTFEKAILTDIMLDARIGRYNKFLMWDTQRREEFLKWLKEQKVEYSELDDAERWAYEDAFDMPDV